MKKIKIKFSISLIFLLISINVSIFFSGNINLLEKIFAPIIFVYFVLDALSVLLPTFNNSIYSGKYLEKFYTGTKKINNSILDDKIRDQNKRSLLIFLSYFIGLTIIGVLYINIESFKIEYLYTIFFAINFADYFCILIWCPFKTLVLKTTCCTRCRIANWDRLMKFYILIFIPSFYSITLLLLGILIFVIWEYNHHIHPERFYSISNRALSCNMCHYPSGCKINKE